QFLIHTKYLCDRKTGLWYHGWTFLEAHNYANALWARGNCWITIAIPEFLEITNEPDGAVRRFLIELLKHQIDTLANYQDANGLWHTIINEPDSYLEASGSAGFAYGILRALHMHLIDSSYLETAAKPLASLLDLIDKDGLVHQVSIGTQRRVLQTDSFGHHALWTGISYALYYRIYERINTQ
ncbi:MAG: glycoside hydrolase family 88 protein, partial [Hungatella sp.]